MTDRAITPAPEPAAFDMAELRKLHGAATPGEWYWGDGPNWSSLETDVRPHDSLLWYTTKDDGVHAKPQDAALIVALHNAFPAIDAEMTRLRERVTELEEKRRADAIRYADDVAYLKAELERVRSE